jgi:hypothetical protein
MNATYEHDHDHGASAKRDFMLEPCDNCGATDRRLERTSTDATICGEQKFLDLCQDCEDEMRRQEAQALAMIEQPSVCEEREILIQVAQSVRALVNALQAHEQTCGACAQRARKPNTRTECQFDQRSVA